MQIHIDREPSEAQLSELGVKRWPIWTKEVSTFPWTYDSTETCYFLEGDVVIVPENADPVRIAAGDLVVFPAGMSCTWDIRTAVRKHYRFD